MISRRIFIRLLGSSASIPFLASCAGSSKLSSRKHRLLYSFLFANDLHITTDKHAKYFEESINNWTTFPQLYDFLVICGDMANYGFVKELEMVRDLCGQLEKPMYPVVGNHDVARPGEEGKVGYRRVFGTNRENYIIEHKSTVLMFLDLSEGMQAHVLLKKHTLDWVQSTLKTIPEETPLIIFTHFPLHPDAPKFPVKNAPELFSLLDSKNVLAYFSGHYHGKWQSTRNGVPFFTNTCLSLKRDNHDNSPEEGYLLVNVFNDSVERHFFRRGTSPVTG